MRVALLSGSVATLLASVALGATWPTVWSEVDDAGQSVSTAQSTIGTGPLEYIDGELLTGSDVDIYRIRITDASAFYVDSGASFDAQLFLFSATGIAVTMADDNAGGGGAVLHGGFVPGVGEYLLAISAYNADPLDASNNLIWNDTPRNLERAPDGPSTSDLLDHWNNAGPTDGGKYKMYLKGVTFVPSPGAISLLGFAGALAARRRRAR